MSDKLSLEIKEDIPKIIDAMVKNQGIHVVDDIVEVLLKHYNHSMLIDMIMNKVDTKGKSQNDFFMVGLTVYRYVYEYECDMKIAISEISKQSLSSVTKKPMKENTIKTHLDNFRILIKKDMKELKYRFIDKDSVKVYINGFFEFCDNGDSINWGAYNLKQSDYQKEYWSFKSNGGVPF